MDEDKVRLKPILGIRPGVYLAFIYGAVILLGLFLLLFAPGLRNPGSVLVLSSEPFGAACRIDGVYQETAPCEIYVSGGKHVLEMVMPGFNSWATEIEVPKRVFASLFFPKKTSIHGELRSVDPAGAFLTQAAEFAAWSFAGEPSAANQIPLSLSEGAYRIGPEANDPEIRDDLENILESSLRFGVTRAALRDLLRAKFLLDNQGISPSPLGLLDSAGDILGLLANTPGASVWIADLLPEGAASIVKSSAWYREEMSAAAAIAETAPEPPKLGDTVMVNGLLFWTIPGGNTVQGELYPRNVSLGSFLIADTEISRDLWERFLEEKPEWKPENTSALIEKGLVTSDYLKDVNLPGAPSPEDKNSPITSVSWYAANAFCEWFNSTLPPAWSNWVLRLPYESEWEYAALAASAAAASASGSIPKMLRNHWEWCENGYYPLEIFFLTEKFEVRSPDRSVRGGSWVNPANLIKADTRASLPPETCSVFVSFRPVLALKQVDQ